MELTRTVTGVAVDLKQARIGIMGVPDKPGIVSKLFTALSQNNISVDMIIQSVPRDGINDVGFTVAKEDLNPALEIYNQVVAEIGAQGVASDANIAKVSIVGAGMINRPGVASTLFNTLAKEGINIQMIATSEIKISCMIDPQYADKAVKAIHTAFELQKSSEPVVA